VNVYLEKTIQPKLIHTITRAFKLLSPRDQKILAGIFFLQVILSIFDLIGVVLIGIIGTLSVYGIQSESVSGFSHDVLVFLKIGDASLQKQVVILGVLVVVIFSSKSIGSLIINKYSLGFVSKRGAILSGKLLSNILGKSLGTIQKNTKQETIYSATSGVQNITIGIIGYTLTVVADFALLVIVFCGLTLINPALSISVVGIFSVIGLLLFRLLGKKAFQVGSIEAQYHIRSNEVILELLDSYREVVVRNTLSNYVKNIQELRMQVAEASARRSLMPYVSKYVLEIVTIVGSFTIAGVQFALFDAKTAIASLVLFLGASTRIGPAVLRIQQGLTAIKNYIGLSAATIDLLEVENTKDSSVVNGVEPLFDYLGFLPDVMIRNLVYQHNPVDSFKLRIDALDISSGSFVALVGPSGSGKSTLIDLILGILEPQEGRILISGKKPRECFDAWPGATAYVPQKVRVINGSIKDNILAGYFNHNPNQSMLDEAVKMSGLTSMVIQGPEGIDSLVGDNGFKLSGGQQQRVGIARALYTNPKLLVLDEATSSLDSVTESDISNAIQLLKGDVTIIAVAHRLSTVLGADKVIYIENGEITATGSFTQVRAQVPDFDWQANLLGL
jgi:ATP-binding cassette subfamily C protein